MPSVGCQHNLLELCNAVVIWQAKFIIVILQWLFLDFIVNFRTDLERMLCYIVFQLGFLQTFWSFFLLGGYFVLRPSI